MTAWRIRLAIALAWVGVISAAVVFMADDRPEIVAVHEALRASVTADQFAARATDALEDDDIETAKIYAETAAFAGYDLPPDLAAELDDAQDVLTVIWREGGSFAAGFATGSSDDLASLGGAVTSDLTVVGDVRDIVIEGGAMVTGEPYDELILVLSGVGLGVTSATWATGGAALPARLGASVLKTAKRSGRLAAPLVREFGILARQAVDIPALRRDLAGLTLMDVTTIRRTAARHMETVRGSRLASALGRLGELIDRVGPEEALRLLPSIHSVGQLDQVAAMAKVLGKKTRAVIELTGKTSLRLFKRGWPLARILIVSLYAVIASIPGWIAWRVTRRVARFAYGRFVRPAPI